MRRFLLVLFLPVFATAQEWVLGEGNQFDFAVGIQYDIEEGVIEGGVEAGLSSWAGDPSAFAPENLPDDFLKAPGPVWTNYDTNGLPSEIFATPVSSSVSTGGTSSVGRFGLQGIGSIVEAQGDYDDGEVVRVALPYISGSGVSVQSLGETIVQDYPSSVDAHEFGFEDFFEGEFASVPALLLSRVSTGMNDFWDEMVSHRQGTRAFVASCCTSVALLHFLWASAVIGSGLFRAVVAGITGISSGGK